MPHGMSPIRDFRCQETSKSREISVDTKHVGICWDTSGRCGSVRFIVLMPKIIKMKVHETSS